GRPVHRFAPGLPGVRLGIGVQGQVDVSTPIMRVANAFGDRRGIEIQAGEITGVGSVAKAEIDAIRAIVDRRFKRGKTARGADQLEGTAAGTRASRDVSSVFGV